MTLARLWRQHQRQRADVGEDHGRIVLKHGHGAREFRLAPLPADLRDLDPLCAKRRDEARGAIVDRGRAADVVALGERGGDEERLAGEQEGFQRDYPRPKTPWAGSLSEASDPKRPVAKLIPLELELVD